MEKKIISAFFQFDKKIPSVNEYYKRARNHVFLNPAVHRYKADITNQLSHMFKDKMILANAKVYYNCPYFKVKIIYILNARRALRDEDNLRKATQDAVFHYFEGIDDMEITDAVSMRALANVPNSFKEFILFQVFVHDEERIYDLTPEESKIKSEYPPIYSFPIKEEKSMELKEQLEEALKLYNEGKPTGLSDPAFDELVNKYGYENYIKDIKTPTLAQGADMPHPDWAVEVLAFQPPKTKIEEVSEMSYNAQTEVKDFKFDGCSIVAYYKDGVPYLVETRGSDYSGKNQTNKLIKMVPQKLDPCVKMVQFEACCCLEDYGETCRQHASGLINSNSADKQIETEMALILVPFNCVTEPWMPKRSRMELLPSLDCVQENPMEPWVKTIRGTIPIDGFVIYKDEERTFSPNRIYKFYGTEKAATEVTNIEWNMSKNGVWIPKLCLKPVMITGSTISHLASGGIEKMMESGLGVGAKVEIVKAGNAIPSLYRILETSHEFMIPVCPKCGQKMTKFQTGVHCEAPGCSLETERITDKIKMLIHVDNTAEFKNHIKELCDNCIIVDSIGVPRVNEAQLCKMDEIAGNLPDLSNASFDAWFEKVKGAMTVAQYAILSKGIVTYKKIVQSLVFN